MSLGSRTRIRRRAAALVVAIIAAVVAVVSAPGVTAQPAVDYTLTILHNNDGESQLISASGEPDYGGVARFKTLVDSERAAATTDGVVMISSGDNFLAGPEFNASLQKQEEEGLPFYDTIAAESFGYDALALGNHDFDFGPDVLADFIDGFTSVQPPTWVSANIDVSAEPRLDALADAGTLVPSVTVTKSGEDIGIIGVETPNLPFISSPRNVTVMGDPMDVTSLAPIIQAEVDALTLAGVDKIILTGHLQDIDNDIELAGALDDVDVIIAGGGDELIAAPGTPLVPGDEIDEDHPEYPVVAEDLDGDDVPIVTTAGEYKYLGNLEVSFDAAGNVIAWEGMPIRVSGVAPDAVVEDPTIKASVTDPVQEALDELAATVLTTSTVDLDGTREGVRGMETNEGNLIADSLLSYARINGAALGANYADVALQNGGGIRNNAIIPAGPLTVLDTFDMVPFSNFVTVLDDLPASQFKEVLENAVSRVDGLTGGTGRFAEVAGFSFTYDPSLTAQVLDEDGNVTTPGSRVRHVELDDGTVIVHNGVLTPTARAINVATIDFLARGGDEYPYRGHPFTILGASYQQALQLYLETGVPINATNYPEGGEGRIQEVEAPICGGLPATIVGTNGADTINGTAGPDVIHGLAGNDTILGLGGRDVICGGRGNDVLRGGTAMDTIFGQKGADTIRGGSAGDTIRGGPGADVISGNRGPDTIWGRLGDDTIFGGKGTDIIRGNAGDDTISGGNKADVVRGNAGDDTLNGDAGDDKLRGGSGTDTCDGGTGTNDVAGCES